MNRSIRMTIVCAALGVLATITGLSSFARDDQSAATKPVGGWFTPTKPANPEDDQSDAAIFARLYPELAKADPAVRAATPRVLFDALGARGKPALKIPPMWVSGGFFTDASTRDFKNSKPPNSFLQVPDERRARMAAVDARQRGASLCLDIESLPLDERYTKNLVDIDRSVRLIAQIVGWVRQQDPNLRVFLYSCFPVGENYVGINRFKSATTKPGGSMFGWWKAAAPNFEVQRQAWLRANARLTRRDEAGGPSHPDDAKTVLSDLFDGTCPSLYLYPNQGMTDTTSEIPAVVREQINEARRYGKPVYPFVWYLLCDTTTPVPLQQWTTLMREVLKYADGAVLWDGPTVWNNRLALRVRIAILLAEKKGEMSDAEIYKAVRADFPGDSELDVLRGDAPATQQAPQQSTQQTQ